jgi:hypothetical protein
MEALLDGYGHFTGHNYFVKGIRETSVGASYHYRCEGGTLIGSGSTVVVKGAENRPLRVYVSA